MICGRVLIFHQRQGQTSDVNVFVETFEFSENHIYYKKLHNERQRQTSDLKKTVENVELSCKSLVYFKNIKGGKAEYRI